MIITKDTKPASNFKEYLKMLCGVNKMMARLLLTYLKREDLYDSYVSNVSKYPVNRYAYDIEQGSQFFGWGFDLTKMPLEKVRFWEWQIKRWCHFVYTTNYEGKRPVDKRYKPGDSY